MIILDMVTDVVRGSPFATLLDQWAADVLSASNGALKIEVYHAGERVAGTEVFDVLDKSRFAGGTTADLGVTTLLNTQDYPDEFLVGLELGFLDTSLEVASQALHQSLTPFSRSTYYFEVLSANFRDPLVLVHNSNVSSAENLVGLKIATYQDVSTEYAFASGALPYLVDEEDLYLALSLGAIDGALIPASQALALGLDEVANKLLILPHEMGFASVPSSLMINNSSMAALPEDLQLLLREQTGISLAKEFAEFELSQRVQALADLESKGVEVSTASGGLLTELEAINSSVETSVATYLFYPQGTGLYNDFQDRLDSLSIRLTNSTDFDADGDTDIVWRNEDGTVHIWSVEDGMRDSGQSIGSASASWSIRAAGDFDQDGDADLLWRNDNGAVYLWEMRDGARIGGGSIGSAGSSWSIKGTGDADQDGDQDIFWFNDVTNIVHLWEMEDGLRSASYNVSALSISDAWNVRGVGDFDNDGDADVLWQNDNGIAHLWELEDGLRTSGRNIFNSPLSSDWQFKSIADFDGDGDDDILFQNNNGRVHIWEMEDGLRVGGEDVATFRPNADVWTLVDTGDFDGDGDDDIIWKKNTGQVHMWEMEDGQRIAGIDLSKLSLSDEWSLIDLG